MWCFGVSGHEILLAVAVFCFAWQRRMSLGQGGVEWGGAEESGGVEWGGAEESGFALCNYNLIIGQGPRIRVLLSTSDFQGSTTRRNRREGT